VPDYDLTRLGSRSFEQLIVSLARRELGPAMKVFGDGPDGGREATFEGTINWAATAVAAAPTDGQPVADGAATGDWSGYTVIQAKYRLNPSSRPRDNAVWLQPGDQGGDQAVDRGCGEALAWPPA